MRLNRLPILLLAIILMASIVTLGFTYDQPALASTYIGNSNTGKFHYASCRWVAKMYDSHKAYFNSRQEAINSGYVSCKVCRP